MFWNFEFTDGFLSGSVKIECLSCTARTDQYTHKSFSISPNLNFFIQVNFNLCLMMIITKQLNCVYKNIHNISVKYNIQEGVVREGSVNIPISSLHSTNTKDVQKTQKKVGNAKGMIGQEFEDPEVLVLDDNTEYREFLQQIALPRYSTSNKRYISLQCAFCCTDHTSRYKSCFAEGKQF